VPITYKDQHWIYYDGSKERHGQFPRDNSIGLATLRLDSFVCLEAKDKVGSVLTKPFRLEGSKLEVNVDAGKGGVIVEVLDAAGKPIPGFTRSEAKMFNFVDQLRLQPEWKTRKDLAPLKDKVVRLKFSLRNAKLYAFQVKP